MPKKPLRNRLLARIHILANERGLTDAEYRDHLEATEGVRSCRDLPEAALFRVVRRLAGEPVPPVLGAIARIDVPGMISGKQIERARRLWAERAEHPTEAALRRFCEGTVGEGELWRLTQREARGLFAALERLR